MTYRGYSHSCVTEGPHIHGLGKQSAIQGSLFSQGDHISIEDPRIPILGDPYFHIIGHWEIWMVVHSMHFHGPQSNGISDLSKITCLLPKLFGSRNNYTKNNMLSKDESNDLKFTRLNNSMT